MKKIIFYFLFLVVLFASCGNKANNNTTVTEEEDQNAYVDSMNQVYEESDELGRIVKNACENQTTITELLQNSIVKKHIIAEASERLFNMIIKNIDVFDGATHIEEEEHKAPQYVFTGHSSSNPQTKVEISFIESFSNKPIVDFWLNGVSVDSRGNIDKGSWETDYLINDFNEKIKEAPYVHLSLRVDEGHAEGANVDILFMTADGGPQFRFRCTGEGWIGSFQCLLLRKEGGQTYKLSFDNSAGDTEFITEPGKVRSLINLFEDGKFDIAVIHYDHLSDGERRNIIKVYNQTRGIKAAATSVCHYQL